MEDVIYVIEDYDSGDMTGYWSKENALKAMVDFYIDSGFGNMYDSIVKAARDGKVDEVQHLLDNVKEDFQTMFGNGHYVDCLMGMREVIIQN